MTFCNYRTHFVLLQQQSVIIRQNLLHLSHSPNPHVTEQGFIMLLLHHTTKVEEHNKNNTEIAAFN